MEVALGEGPCPAEPFTFTTTSSDGSFAFIGVAAGTYCVSVDALSVPNVPLLLPGEWTLPVGVEEPVGYTVELAAGEAAPDLRFGWDYQFLPARSSAAPVPRAEVRLSVTVRAVEQFEPVVVLSVEPVATGDALVDGIDMIRIPARLPFESAAGDPVTRADLQRCTTLTVAGLREGNMLRAEEVTVGPVAALSGAGRPVATATGPTTLHEEPDPAAATLGALEQGSELRVAGRCLGWLSVETAGGQTGWVSGEAVSLSGETQARLPVLPAGPRAVTHAIAATVQSVGKNLLFIEPTDGFTAIMLMGDTQIYRANGEWADAAELRGGVIVEAEGRPSPDDAEILEAARVAIQGEAEAGSCESVATIVPESPEGEAIIQTVERAVLDIHAEQLADAEKQPEVAGVVWIYEAGGWVLIWPAFDFYFEPAIFALRSINDSYFFEGIVWSGRATDEAQIREEVRSRVPEAPAALVECVELGIWVEPAG